MCDPGPWCSPFPVARVCTSAQPRPSFLDPRRDYLAYEPRLVSTYDLDPWPCRIPVVTEHTSALPFPSYLNHCTIEPYETDPPYPLSSSLFCLSPERAQSDLHEII